MNFLPPTLQKESGGFLLPFALLNPIKQRNEAFSLDSFINYSMGFIGEPNSIDSQERFIRLFLKLMSFCYRMNEHHLGIELPIGTRVMGG